MFICIDAQTTPTHQTTMLDHTHTHLHAQKGKMRDNFYRKLHIWNLKVAIAKIQPAAVTANRERLCIISSKRSPTDPEKVDGWLQELIGKDPCFKDLEEKQRGKK